MLVSLRRWLLRPPVFWRLNVLAWVTFGLFSFAARLTYYPSLEAAVLLMPVQVLLAIGFSGLLRAGLQQWATPAPWTPATLVAVVGLSLGAAVVHGTLIHALLESMDWGNPAIRPDVALLLRIKVTCLVYMGWCLGFFAVRGAFEAEQERVRTEWARRRARDLELQLLRSQLDPHFLFNSLNGIAAEIAPHPQAATVMVEELAGYLRYSLDHRHQALAHLADELEAMRDYLAIEKARFGDRLEIILEATPEARRRKLPAFLLQSLVENAVKHGAPGPDGVRRVILRASVSGKVLKVVVSNTGDLTTGPLSEGTGTAILRRRLDLHYPGTHAFHLRGENGMVQAELELAGDPCFGS